LDGQEKSWKYLNYSDFPEFFCVSVSWQASYGSLLREFAPPSAWT